MSRWLRASATWMLVFAPYFAGIWLLLASSGGFAPNGNVYGTVMIMPTYGVLAGILMAFAPRHPIAWLFVLVAGFSAADVLVGGLLERSIAHGELGPPGPLLAAVESVIWIPQVLAVLTIAFLFPDGRFTSRRWLVGYIGASLGLGVALLGYVTLPGPLDQWALFESPFGVADPSPDLRRTFASSITALAAILAFASALVRFRSARGETRAQLKWFAFAAAVTALTLAPGAMLYFAPPPLSTIATTIASLPLAFLFPAAVAAAILRFHLYDVDLLIRRTLVYAAVTVVLVISYGAAVLSLQAVLRPLTAGSDLAVAASTLLVVALFQPIRRRMQEVVDRRFYRSRYDSARAVDSFTARLRDEADIDAVRSDLVGVVDDALRPAHASVWLRQAER